MRRQFNLLVCWFISMLLFAACTKSTPTPAGSVITIQEPESTVSTPTRLESEEGGLAQLSAGATVEIPPRTRADDRWVDLLVQNAGSPPALPDSAEGVIVTEVYDLQPDGAMFATPVTITVPYDPGLLPEGIDETALVVLLLEEGRWASDPNSRVVAYDHAEKRVSFVTTHFSKRAIGASTRQAIDPAEIEFNKAFHLWFWGIEDVPLSTTDDFEAIVDKYPESPWAIRSLWFLGDNYAKEWVFGPQQWEGRDYKAYRDNLQNFARALEYWDEFLEAPDQGPGPLLSNPAKYPQHDDVKNKWASYVPYGLEVYRYLEEHHWFDGSGALSDPLPLMATTRILWTESDDLFDTYYTAWMSPDELPQTVRQDIAHELARFGAGDDYLLTVVKQVASVGYIQVPALVDRIVDVYEELKAPVEGILEPIIGLEEAIYKGADQYVAKMDIDPEEREDLRGGVYVLHVGASGIIRTASESWLLLESVVIEGLRQLEEDWFADVSFEDLPRGKPYPFLVWENPEAGRPAFVIVYRLVGWNEDHSTRFELYKHWALLNVNAGETPVDNDRENEVTPNFHEDDRNWETFLVDGQVTTFPLLRFREGILPEVVEATPGVKEELDLTVEYKLDRPTQEESETGLLVVTVQVTDDFEEFETVIQRGPNIAKTPYSWQESTMPLGTWEEMVQYVIFDDTEAIRVCLELYDDPNASQNAIRKVCSEPIPVVRMASACNAPTLLTPADGQGFEPGENLLLEWSYNCPLAEEEYFDVRVWREGDPHYGVTWAKDTRYWVDYGAMGGGRYYWSVAVVRGRDGKVESWVTDEASARWFEWKEAASSPGPCAWKDKIVGHWSIPEASYRNFSHDGSTDFGCLPPLSCPALLGTYKCLDNGKIRIDFGSFGVSAARVSVSQNKLTLSFSDREETYLRTE